MKEFTVPKPYSSIAKRITRTEHFLVRSRLQKICAGLRLQVTKFAMFLHEIEFWLERPIFILRIQHAH